MTMTYQSDWGNSGARPEMGLGVAAPQYRLPDALRLGRVVLQVAELDRSVSFYRDVLGLTVLSQSESRATLGTEGAADPIVELRERPGAASAPRGGKLGLYHFAILLPDRAALGGLIAHLGRSGVRFGASDHLVSEAIYLNDPDGLGIEVYADRPRTSWTWENRQLQMATKPLDLMDLVRAAEGSWRGVPIGTVLGHVHLHVGEIESAAAFYHEALGFDKVVWSYPGALFLSAGGYHHHLGVNTWAAGADSAGDDDARLVEWEIVLPTRDDVMRTLDSIESAGFPIERGPKDGTARDPWGTRVRIRAEAGGNSSF
jgi:catechol 2,3-dioxygenase